MIHFFYRISQYAMPKSAGVQFAQQPWLPANAEHTPRELPKASVVPVKCAKISACLNILPGSVT